MELAQIKAMLNAPRKVVKAPEPAAAATPADKTIRKPAEKKSGEKKEKAATSLTRLVELTK